MFKRITICYEYSQLHSPGIARWESLPKHPHFQPNTPPLFLFLIPTKYSTSLFHFQPNTQPLSLSYFQPNTPPSFLIPTKYSTSLSLSHFQPNTPHLFFFLIPTKYSTPFSFLFLTKYSTSFSFFPMKYFLCLFPLDVEILSCNTFCRICLKLYFNEQSKQILTE